MSRAVSTCVMLLSDKSSGSTALQDELAKHPAVNLVKATTHNENETLYWNKAAAVLGLPQVNMLNSQLPIGQRRAKQELIEFLKANLDSYNPPADDERLVFEGWRKLCCHYGPIFLEKSPHHLHYWSALKLIAECDARYPEINFKFCGLVRNPVATLYSMWKRWQAVPEQQQYEWLRAYKNLLNFKSLVGDRLQIVRYEDLVNDRQTIKQLCDFAGIEWMPNIGRGLRTSSVSRWRQDKMFGFQPSLEITHLSRELGYTSAELSADKRIAWPMYREVTRAAHRGARFLRPWKRTVKDALRGSIKLRVL